MAPAHRSALERLRHRLRQARGADRHRQESDDELERLLRAAERALAVEDDPDD